MPETMNYDAANRWLKRRLSATTALGSREIADNVPPKVRANTFFSARVAEGRIIDRLREVSDRVSRGEIGVTEARNQLKGFLSGAGYTPGGVGPAPAGVNPQAWAAAQSVTNLASTARLNLILRQQAAMANAVGVYQVGRDPDVEKRWPNWRYVALPGARSTHAALNGKVFRKSDPVWRRIFPPWEYGCRCQVEDCGDEEAEKYGGVLTAVTMPPRPASGYRFDPRDALASLDLGRLKLPDLRAAARLQLEAEYGDQVSRKGDVLTVKPNPEYRGWKDKGLKPAGEWPMTLRPPVISASEARARLTAGIKLRTPDGIEVTLDEEIIRHWREDGKSPRLESDINGRLAYLDSAIGAVEGPTECWEQESQNLFFRAFDKGDGGFRGVMVAVTKDNRARTYFFKSASAMDAARKGLKVKKY